MASPRLETYCCPNRDAATQLVMNFQPEVFCGVCIASASINLLLTILQLLPKKGQSPRKMPKASSSSTILLLISICDIFGGLGKRQLDVPHTCCSQALVALRYNSQTQLVSGQQRFPKETCCMYSQEDLH